MPVEKEIFDQKTELREVLKYLRDFKEKEKWKEKLTAADEVYFIGCGSSYYIGIAASKYFTGTTGKRSRALPAGEILEALRWNIPRDSETTAVLISRSGETTEVIEATKMLKENGIFTLGITLEQGSSLTKVADSNVTLPLKEESVVMTKSFTSMLMFLMNMSDFVVGIDKSGLYEDLLGILERQMDSWEKEAQEVAKKGKHFVFLGVGPYEGIARESALKLQEMSLTTTEAYSTLEYRHGPKSLVSKDVVVVIFGEGESSKKLAKEIEKLGGHTLLRRSYAKGYEDSFVLVIFSQLLGLSLAKLKGVDVESPRNLSKVVIIDE